MGRFITYLSAIILLVLVIAVFTFVMVEISYAKYVAIGSVILFSAGSFMLSHRDKKRNNDNASYNLALVVCDLMVAQKLFLPETEFDEFREYCREKGFDLSYFGPCIVGSKKEIERYQFDVTKVIKLKKRRFSFSGTPYDVAEWQQERWKSSLPQIRDDFFKKGAIKSKSR